MNPAIFREYDVRGVADRDLTDELASDVGRAFGTFLRRRGQHRIVVGRDCRLSSPRLHAALSRGLLETGLTLVDIGTGPSPLMYFSVFHLDADGGVQVTASHNPSQDNGFKLMSGKATLAGDEVRELRTLIERRDFELHEGGTRERWDPLPAYAGYMRGNIRLARTDVRFAIDAGNGAGGPTALAAMQAVGLEPRAMHCEMDGAFPNHHPDPSLPQNMQQLVARVQQDGLELGIAYDGDADRIGVVDNLGNIVSGDRLMILLSRQILERQPGAAILGEVKCSQTLYDDIEQHGGRPIIWKAGHSTIKKKMKEEHALLAGEMSGHVFFADRYFGYDDAVYASLRVLEIVAGTKQSLAELLSDVPTRFATPELRVATDDDLKFEIVRRVLQHYQATHEVLDIDGARIKFPGGWGLVRASNTQAALVLRFEADTAGRLDEIRSEIERVVAQSQHGAR